MGKDLFSSFLSNHKLKEVDTEYILTLLQGKDKEVIVPRMEPNFDLAHILLTDATPIRNNPYGIPEPVGGIALSPATIEVVFVPLLAYDVHGNRIGYGKGYYDRFLAQCDQNVVLLGCLFSSRKAHSSRKDRYKITLLYYSREGVFFSLAKDSFIKKE